MLLGERFVDAFMLCIVRRGTTTLIHRKQHGLSTAYMSGVLTWCSCNIGLCDSYMITKCCNNTTGIVASSQQSAVCWFL